VATFVVVRHAEKRLDDAVDPALSELGQARAQRLANLLGDRSLVAAYATQFRRTRETAQPSTSTSDIGITAYDAAVPATVLATQLLEAHPRGTVLVVGHSNTVAAIVGALSGQAVEALTEAQFDVIHEVHIDSQGRASVERSSY
jgi:broad specificity phosphatase PhoE